MNWQMWLALAGLFAGLFALGVAVGVWLGKRAGYARGYTRGVAYSREHLNRQLEQAGSRFRV